MDVDRLMDLIQTQILQNEELITVISKVRHQTIPHKTYSLRRSTPDILKLEKPVHASLLMSRFPPAHLIGDLLVTDDMKLFGDSFDLSVSDFQSIVRLQE
jgi:hypothetical protein